MARRGLTLFELLVVLAILSAATLAAGSALSLQSQKRQIWVAAKTLETDLKRARLKSEIAGTPTTIRGDQYGYQIGDEDRREFPHNVTARWNGEDKGRLVFGGTNNGTTIELAGRQGSTRVVVAPLTGRISVE